MAGRPVEEKVIKMSVDNAEFKNQLQQSIDSLKKFQKSMDDNTQVKSDKAETGLKRIGSAISKLASHVPILKNFKKSVDDNTDIKGDKAEKGVSRIGSAISKLTSHIPILKNFKKSADDAGNINGDKAQSGINKIGSAISSLTSKIPILRNFKKSAEESTNVSSTPFGNFVNKVTSAVSSLTSKIPIFGKFKQSAEEGMNIDAGGVEDGVAQANSALGKLGTGTAQVAQQFTAMQAVAFGALSRIGEKAIDTGLSLVKSMSVDKISEGFQQYNDYTASVMQLTGALGSEATPAINAALTDLDHYAAVTKYSIADMNTNLAQFVNNGVSLKDSQTAIKGWGNLAASAGASTQAFGASLQFGVSQALAMGKMTTQNWMSVENAGMATQKFKDQLVEQAKAMGKNVDMSGGFRDSLQQGWLTNDVFIASLKKLSSNQDMVKMAQDFHTFGEVSDAVTEGVTAGWSRVFQSIFGELPEATKMWTSLGNIMIDFTSGNKSMFEGLTKGAKTFGDEFRRLKGLDAIVKVVTAALTSLGQITGALKGAMSDVFPVDLKKTAKDVVDGLNNMVKKLTVSKEAIANVRTVATAFFNILKLSIDIVKGVGNALVGLIPKGAGNSITDLIVKFAQWINRMTQAIYAGEGLTAFMGSLREISESLSAVIGKVVSGVGKFAGSIAGLAGGGLASVGKIIKGVADSIAGLFSKFDGVDFTQLATLGGIALIATKVGNITKHFKNLGDGIKDAGENIGKVTNIFKELPKSLQALTTAVKAGTLLEIAIALGVLSGALLILSTIDVKSLASSLTALTIEFKILTVGLSSLSKDLGTVSLAKMVGVATALQILAGAMVTVSVAVKILSTIKPAELATALAGLAGAMLIMAKGMQALGKVGPSVLTASTAMLIVAAALNALAIPIKVFSKMSFDEIAKGLGTFAGAMIIMVASLKMMSKVSAGPEMLISAASIGLLALAMTQLSVALILMGAMDIIMIAKSLVTLAASLLIMNKATKDMSVPKGMIAFTAGMYILAKSLQQLASMSWTEIGKSLTAMAGAIAILGLLSKYGAMDMKSSAGFALMAAGLIPLALAMKVLSTIPVEGVATALVSFGGAVGIMVLAAKGLQGALPGVLGFVAASGGMLILSVAIAGLAASFKLLSNIPIEKVGVGLLAFAGILAVVIAAGYAMSGAAFGLIAFGAAMLLLGGAVALAGIGVKALAEAFDTLSKINFGIAIKNFKSLVDAVIKMIPDIIKAVLEATAQILQGFVDLSPEIVGAMKSMITDLTAIIPDLINFFLEIIDQVGPVVESLGNLIIEVISKALQGITVLAPQFGAAFLVVVSTGIAVLRGLIPQFINLGLDIVQALLSGIASHISDFIKTAADIATNFITGLIDGITSNVPKVVSHLMSAGIEMLNGLATAFDVYGGAVTAAVLRLFNSIAQTVITAMAGVLVAMLEPFDQWTGGMSKKVSGAADSAKEALDKSFSTQEAKALGEAKANGYVEGLNAPVTNAAEAGKALSDAAKNGVTDTSDVLNILGSKGGQAYVQGIKDGSIDASAAGAAMKSAAEQGASGGDLTALAQAFGGTYSNGVFTMQGSANSAGYSLKVSAESGTAGGDASANGSSLGGTFNSGVGSKQGESKGKGDLLKHSTLQGLQGGDASGKGSVLGGTFTSGVGSKEGAASTAGNKVKNAAKTPLDNPGSANSSGASLGNSFADGLLSAVGNAAAAAGKMIQSIKDHFPNSPAKTGPLSGAGWVKIRKSGLAITKEFSLGLTEGMYQTNDASNAVMEGVRDSLENISDIVNNTLDLDPTITPTIDTSKIQTMTATRFSSIVRTGVDANVDLGNIDANVVQTRQNEQLRADITKGLSEIKDGIKDLSTVTDNQTAVIKDGKVINTYVDKDKISRSIYGTVDQMQKRNEARLNRLDGNLETI